MPHWFVSEFSTDNQIARRQPANGAKARDATNAAQHDAAGAFQALLL